MKTLLKRSLFLSCFILCAMGIMAQTASGIVVDATGEPAIGATILEVGTTNGTITDFDGNFTLAVAENAQITVSLVGYKSVTLAAKENLRITLQEDVQLVEEIVVTGYTTQRKADLSGAVSVLDMDKPISQTSANMLNSLQGRLAGVQITTDAAPGGGGTTIRVRGMSTINGNNPLYIIDGVPTTENLNSLNPNDIESMQVLKDASSASIYGSRAANGVIIITTKKGASDRLAVNFSASASCQTVAKQFDMLNAQQWGEAFWAASTNAGLKPSHPFYGRGETPELVEYLDGDAQLVPSTDNNWQDAIYSPAWAQNYSLDISNSGKNGAALLSLNYTRQDGLMEYSFFERFTARVNSNYKIGKWVNIGENIMIARWNDRGFSTNDDRGVPYTAMRQHPAIPVYDKDGKFTNPLTLASSDIANPMQTLYNARDNENQSWRIFGNAFIEVFPVEGLTLKSNIGIEHVQYFNRALGRKVQESDKNNVSRAYGQGDTWTWTNTANYNLNKDNHRFNILIGTEAIGYTYEGISAYRDTYAFEDENYMTIDAGEGTQTNGGGKSTWGLFSLFAKADYNYADRYLLSATIRRDATSRLYKENNAGWFPAFSAAWRFTAEPFYPENEVLTNGKVRVGWGQNGNSAIDNYYAAYSTFRYDQGNGAYDLNATNSDAVAGIIVSASGNPDLKWETTTQTNIGLDLAFASNSVNLTFDYYFKNTKDMLTIPPTLSVSGENAAVWMNTGTMKNQGFELALEYHSPSYNGFTWNAALNLSRYQNELVELNPQVKTMGGDYRLIAGEAMGVYYGYVVDGIFQNQDQVNNHAEQQGKGIGRLIYRDLDGNGIVNEKDQCIIGNPNPELAAGLNLDFSYKGITLSAFFTGEFGFDIYNTTKRQLDFMSYGDRSTNRGTSVLNAWTPENTSATVPMLSSSDPNNEMRMSTYFVEDGSYGKLKYLKLSYDLPKKALKAMHAQGFNIYAQVENVCTITRYSGLDPEVPLGGYGARVDNAPYPSSRNFSFGINVSF